MVFTVMQQKIIENYSVDKVKKFWYYRRQVKRTLLQVLGLCIFPNFRYPSKCFVQICRAQYGTAMLVELCAPPTWWAENSANIWNLLWLSRQLIIWTEPTNIYISTFPNTLTPKKAKNHVTHSHNSELQTVLVFKQSTLLSWKVVTRCKFRSPYALWG